MALPLSSLPAEIVSEVRARKWLVFAVFILVSFLVLAVGFIWPYQYRSEVTVFVDDQNIIGPLMQGSAVTTKISERTSSARQTLSNSVLLANLATEVSIFGDDAKNLSEKELESRVAELRSNLNVRSLSGPYFAIQYSSESPVEAFRVSQRLGQLFIAESAKRKRAESRGAYDFIDRQVNSYENQLAEVEKRLQEFLSVNTEGTEGQASSRMSGLKSQLEVAQLEKTELNARIDSLQDQLTSIDPTIRQGRTADAFQQRISGMESQLDDLRLRYHDTYPDIVILKEQIAELKNQRNTALAEGVSSAQVVSGEDIVNPLYQDLRSSLSKARADVETINTRINSLGGLIMEQDDRMEKVQANKTQFAEITRDLNVNTQIYNDLLKRRESARVSMHLDIEGKGLNFEIYESAQFPTQPYDMKFSTFAVAGLFLGILAPLGAIAGLLQIDPRVRSRQQLEMGLGLPVLAEIPRVRTPFEKRRERWATVVVSIFSIIAIAIYVAIAGAALIGAV